MPPSSSEYSEWRWRWTKSVVMLEERVGVAGNRAQGLRRALVTAPSFSPRRRRRKSSQAPESGCRGPFPSRSVWPRSRGQRRGPGRWSRRRSCPWPRCLSPRLSPMGAAPISRGVLDPERPVTADVAVPALGAASWQPVWRGPAPGADRSARPPSGAQRRPAEEGWAARVRVLAVEQGGPAGFGTKSSLASAAGRGTSTTGAAAPRARPLQPASVLPESERLRTGRMGG